MCICVGLCTSGIKISSGTPLYNSLYPRTHTGPTPERRDSAGTMSTAASASVWVISIAGSFVEQLSVAFIHRIPVAHTNLYTYHTHTRIFIAASSTHWLNLLTSSTNNTYSSSTYSVWSCRRVSFPLVDVRAQRLTDSDSVIIDKQS